MKIATFIAALGATCALPAGAAAPAASVYPDRPVVWVVPFGAGSATDGVARVLGQEVARETGQRIVVDNRPGASGFLAAQAVARSAADGHTAFITTDTTQAANAHLFRRLPYDPVKDFAPVTALARGYQVMATSARAPLRTVARLMAAARKDPGKLTFGEGSASARVAMELFQQMTGTHFVHVPYKSNPLAVTDLIAGDLDVMIVDMPTGLPHVRSGRLSGLAVTSPRRLPQAPDLPTLSEVGVKDYEMSYWFAAYLPARTAAVVVRRLNALLHGAVATAAAQAFFAKSALEPYTTTSEALAEFQAAETDKWGEIIRRAGIQPE